MSSNKSKAITKALYQRSPSRFKQNSPAGANTKTFGNVSFRDKNRVFAGAK